jgi:hypothetical protein
MLFAQQSVGTDLRAELEMQVRLELNKKLARLNAFLQQHAEECAKIDRLRDANEVEIRKQIQNAEKELRVSCLINLLTVFTRLMKLCVTQQMNIIMNNRIVYSIPIMY